jgi:ribosomal protein S8
MLENIMKKFGFVKEIKAENKQTQTVAPVQATTPVTTHTSSATNNLKLASPAQYALYVKMTGLKKQAMEEKNLPVISETDFMKLTSKQASDKINILQTIIVTFKATDNQTALIKILCERAGMAEPPMLDKMTSAQASDFITKINAFISSRPALATDKQVERINSYIKSGLMTIEGLEKSYKVDAPAKLQKKDASDIIDSFEEAYRTWRDTHVTDKQIEYIQSLQERLGDMIIQAEELAVMTRETASQLIEQLEKEWKNRQDYAKQQVSNYKDLTDRSKETEAKMKLSIGEREFEDKITMCNKLYVLIGQQPEGLDAVGFNEIDGLVESLVSMARLYVEDGAIVEALGLNELADVIGGAEA